MHKYTWKTGIREGALIVVGIAFLLPLYALINMALKPNTNSPLAPAIHPTLKNITAAWSQANLGRALLNSAIVTVGTLVLLIFIACLAAYYLARTTSKFSSTMFNIFLLGLLIPPQVALIPMYTTIRNLGLLGKPWGLILWHVGQTLPFAIFVYTRFLRHADRAYEEAALVDGAEGLKLLRYVVFPLLRPVTGTIVILNAIFTWNDFFAPLLFLSGSPNATVPVALYSFTGQYFNAWNLVFAGLVVGSLPILVIYFLMQGTIIKGFAGGLKG